LRLVFAKDEVDWVVEVVTGCVELVVVLVVVVVLQAVLPRVKISMTARGRDHFLIDILKIIFLLSIFLNLLLDYPCLVAIS
jgi:hypothetical protein